MKEALIVKVQTENGEVHLCRNPLTGVWELAKIEKPKSLEKRESVKPNRPKKQPFVTMEQIDKTDDEWRELIKFLNYLDECAKEEVKFLEPALEAARTGKYPPKKLKPQRKKEAQKPFWTVIMGDPRVPYAEKSRYLVKWLKEEAMRDVRK
ncbi:MAG: hypothetical protein QXX51_01350 [Candidatus Bathyarchaeia archaeon]